MLVLVHKRSKLFAPSRVLFAVRIPTVLSLFASIAIIFAACKKEKAELQCPECWDEKAICIDGKCECPEEAIVTHLNTAPSAEGENVFPPRQFCVLPDKLTFIGYLPQFLCVDTFAIAFPYEPLEGVQLLPTGTPRVHQLAPGVTFGLSNMDLIFDEDYPEGLGMYIRITNIQPTYGYTLGHGCLELKDGEITGGARIDFGGYFSHPDTVVGKLRVIAADGKYSDFDGQEVEVNLIRTLPYDI